MVDNSLDGNIFIEVSENNIFLIDPNRVLTSDGNIKERDVKHENLIMYANLEAKIYPRTKLIVGAPIDDAIQNQKIASFNFLSPGGETFMNNKYVDEITGFNTLDGNGINQPSLNVKTTDKSNNFYLAQNTKNRKDTGLLGIESISIRNTRSFTPTVDMVLIDVMGRALFEKGEDSEYAFFFNLPYPMFYLTLKGYYGRAIRYELILTNFSAAFESATGNYRINLKFYSYKYTVLAETSVGALYAVPYMYTKEYQVNPVQQPPAVGAAQTSNGNNLLTTFNIKTSRGRDYIKQIYQKYKNAGLLKKDFPELTFAEFLAAIQGLEKFLEQSYGLADFSPLDDGDTYFKLLNDYREIITDQSSSSSWFSMNVDPSKPYVLNIEPDTQETLIAWIFNENKRKNKQEALNGLAELEKIVNNYTNTLGTNKTYGLNGSFVIENNRFSSGVKSITKIDAKISPVVSAITYNTFVKQITPDNINWEATFEMRNKRKPLSGETESLRQKESEFFSTVLSENSLNVPIFPTYNFVFEGKKNFLGIIDQCFKEFAEQRLLVTNELNNFLAKKIEGPTGLGFKPTIRNVMGIIFASIEAFYRLMDQVHSDAWDKRNNPIRKRAIFTEDNPDKPNSTDTQPVYPWPLYLKKDKDGKYEVMYPGEYSEVFLTRGSDFSIWPEIEFVEEYIKGLQNSQESLANISPTQSDLDGSGTVNRITVNGVEFPTNNIILSDYQDVKFLYEIYERFILSAFYDRIANENSESLSVHSDIATMEFTNIKSSLNGYSSPNLIKVLKNINLSSDTFLTTLRKISNDGTGLSYQQFIRGIFTSEYMRTITKNDYAILSNNTISSANNGSNKNPKILSKLKEFVKSPKSTTTDFLDLLPFRNSEWVSQNMVNVKNNNKNLYDTTSSLFLNPDINYITNFEKPSNYDTNLNRPFVNNSFLKVDTPNIPNNTPFQANGNNSTVGFNVFYDEKINTNSRSITEGLLKYSNKTGNLTSNQTVSMINTPFFINAIMEGVENEKNNVPNPYIAAAYLFINSLPLATLREKYKNIGDNNTDLNYLFSTLTKFSAVHRIPYPWILKLGSIWYRYKTFINDGVDILNNSWKSIPTEEYYDPTTLNLSTEYNFPNYQNKPTTIFAQKNILGSSSSYISTKNVGFYPKIINDLFFFITGQNLMTGYTSNDIQKATLEGLKIGSTNSTINLQEGFDPTALSRSLKFNGWFVTFDTNQSPKFGNNLFGKTIILPSFGTTNNQVFFECFEQGSQGIQMTQEVFRNKAVDDGSIRFFWDVANFGYFETPSINKPNYDEYLNNFDSSQNNSEAFTFSTEYSKIEEIFGVFKTEILDSFADEFLAFSKSKNKLLPEDVDPTYITFKNFQNVFTNCLIIDQIPNTLDEKNYVSTCAKNQNVAITNRLNSFLNFDIAFKFGNPGNFDRRLFGTFTTLPTYRVVDEYTYNPYVLGSLPGDSIQTNLIDSQFRYPNAWKTLRNYVGFSTIENVQYSSSGSYITDFFITMNIEFESTNVITFAPLIKIFATQKLLNNGNYDRANFILDINDFYLEKNTFMELVMNETMLNLRKSLPEVQDTTTKPIRTSLDGVTPKLELWSAFKAFNDKWISGSDFNEKLLFEQVVFLDRANRDIGDLAIIDVFSLSQYASSFKNMSSRVIDLISKIIADNKFLMMPMPAYINWWGQGQIKNGINPKPQSVEDVANNLFGVYNDVDTRYAEPTFLCYYVGNPSEHLVMGDTSVGGYRNDSFDLRTQNPLNYSLKDKTDWKNSNMVVGFNVDFGTRNQAIFTSLQLDQNSAAATTEANRVVTEIAAQAGGTKTSLQNISLYNLYKVRSYTARIECLGNMMLQPTMYFNLKHVPMFTGPYMIQSVEHKVEAGRFMTFFEGIRMPIYSIPMIDKQLISINQSVYNTALNLIKRKRETSPVNSVTSNIIAIGNSIQTNISFQSVEQGLCFNSITTAKNPYNTFQGTEGIITSIPISNFAEKLKSISNKATRIMTFFTAYVNGYKDDKINSFNYDLGGTPLAGYQIPNIDYGQLNVNLDKKYMCKKYPNGETYPFATFTDFDKSINFIKTRFSGNILNQNQKIGYNGLWNEDNDIARNAVILWINYYPQKRFQNDDEYKEWTKNNLNMVDTIGTISKQSLEQMKKFGLI